MSNATDTVYNTGYNSGYNAGYAVGPSQYNKSFSIPISWTVETDNEISSITVEGTMYFNPYTGAKSGLVTLAAHARYYNGSSWQNVNASKRKNI